MLPARSARFLEGAHRSETGRNAHPGRVRVQEQTDRGIDIFVSKAHEPEQLRYTGIFCVIGEQMLVSRARVIQAACPMQLERPIQNRGIRRV